MPNTVYPAYSDSIGAGPKCFYINETNIIRLSNIGYNIGMLGMYNNCTLQHLCCNLSALGSKWATIKSLKMQHLVEHYQND